MLTHSWVSVLTSPLVKLGELQLRLSSSAVFSYMPGIFYLCLYVFLGAIPSLLHAPSFVYVSFGIIELSLGLGLVWICFSYDSERVAALRGVFDGEGRYVIVKRFGELGNPQVEIVEKFPRRLRLGTLLAGGWGMTIGFALVCQGLHESGLSSWFQLPKGVSSANTLQWVAFALLNVFRSVDIFDTLTIYGIEQISFVEVARRMFPPLFAWLETKGLSNQSWATASYFPIHQRGAAASSMIWIFRASIKIMLLNKLRRIIEAYSLYRQVVSRTQSPPAQAMHALMVPSLGATLLETESWVGSYVHLYLRKKHAPITTRVFAAKVVAQAGLESRRFCMDMLNVMEDARTDGDGHLIQELLTAIGRLEVQTDNLDLPRNKSLTIPEPRFGVIWSDLE